MELVSLIVGFVLGVLVVFLVGVVMAWRKKRQMEKMFETVFGDADFLDNLGAAFVIPDPEPPVNVIGLPPRPRRPVRDNPQG